MLHALLAHGAEQEAGEAAEAAGSHDEQIGVAGSVFSASRCSTADKRGTIDRTDFGRRWKQVLETGGFLVGEEVKIVVDVSAVRQP